MTTVVGFPGKPTIAQAAEAYFEEQELPKYPFGNEELGKPHMDINGTSHLVSTDTAILGVNDGYVKSRISDGMAYSPDFGHASGLDYKEDKTNPPHYKHLPVECIELTEHMSFCLGNVIKYIYRCNLKGGTDDLRKAQWYLAREIARRGGGESNDAGC